jgi:hypothetical protein
VASPTVYRERLAVAWWVWPAAVGASALLAAELGIGAYALRTPVTYVIAAMLAVTGVWALSRIRITIDHEELRVDDARLPLSFIDKVTVLDASGRRDLLGQDADPLAFVVQRPWIPGGVRIDLVDPDDPTPYWFVSSRHPDDLAAALRR